MRRAALARLGICLAMAGAAVPTLAVEPAHACSSGGASDAEHVRTARAVFTGTVIGREQPVQPMQGSGDPVIYTFAVDRVYKNYKGRIANPQRVESVVDGASCGLELRGNGPFVIFTSERPFATVPSAGLCGGSRALEARERLPFGRGRAPAAAPTEPPSSEVPDTLGPTVDDDEDGSAAGKGLLIPAAALALIGGGIFLRQRGRRG